MSMQDKVVLLNRIEDTLKPRMFANMLEEATEEIQDTLTDFNVEKIAGVNIEEDDFLSTFITAKRVEGATDKTLLHYQYSITRFLKFAAVGAKEVRTEHIRAYFENELARGISPNTLKGTREVLSSFFGWLDKEHLIRYNPILGIAPIKAIYDVKESYSLTDVERIKRACTCIRDLAIISMLSSTACRITELCQLNMEDIDLFKGEATVFGKGKKERKVYLDEVAIMLVKEYLATRVDDNPALFIGKRKERMQPGGIRAMLKKIEEKSGVENIHPHRFRRTKITSLLNRGMSIQNVAIFAGHNKIDTTMKYYYANSENIRLEYMKYSQ